MPRAEGPSDRQILSALAGALGDADADSALRVWTSSTTNQAGGIQTGFQTLSSENQGLIRRSLGTAALNEFLSLSQERDPAFRAESLLQFAARQEGSRPRLALALYSLVEQTGPETALRARARNRLAVLRGGGSFGQQCEFFGGQLTDQVLDPSLLVGMTAASLTFQTIRLGVLGRLAAGTGAPFWRIGTGARTLAWTAAFGAEFPTFALTVRGMREALGHHQDWSGDALQRDLILSGVSLFGLKATGLATQSTIRRLGISPTGWAGRVLPQAGMFTGILGAQGLETALGLRPPSDGRAAVIQSLATLAHFNISAHLLRGLSWPALERLAPEGELRGSLFSRPLTSFTGWDTALGPRLPALVGIPNPARAPEIRPWQNPNVFMSSNGGESPPPLGKSNGNGTHIRLGSNGHSLTPIKNSLDLMEGAIHQITMNPIHRHLWGKIIHETNPELLGHLRTLRNWVEADHTRGAELPFLADIQATLDRIPDLLRWDGSPQGETRYFPASDRWEVQRFLTYYYKGINTLVNYLDGGAPPNEPLNNFSYAVNWLGRALHVQSNPNPTSTSGVDFPYLRTDKGSFKLPNGRMSVVVLGDDMGARTRELAEQGHQIVFIDPKLMTLRLAQRIIDRWETEARAQGRLNHDVSTHFVQGDWLKTQAQGDLVEAYYPAQLNQLPPRSTPDARRAELEGFLEHALTSKIVGRGSGFILSDQLDALSDLAEVIRSHPRLKLLEFVGGTTRLPLRGGRAVTAEEGEELISWLVFRRRGGDTVPPPFAMMSAMEP